MKPVLRRLSPSSGAANQRSTASKNQHKRPEGISLFDGGEQQFLFPGYRPLYSEGARKLLFSYQGLLYLWDPLLSRRKGLLLLTKGFEPQWAPDGRVIAYLRQPFSWRMGTPPQGGGIMLVDMFFRAAPVTPSGGQVAWDGQGNTLAYVDRTHPAKPKGVSAPIAVGIYWLNLRKKSSRPILLRKHAWHPALSQTVPQKTLLAFVDREGVWVMDTEKKKAILVASGASLPQWSSRGELLVVYPKAVAVIPWTVAAQQKLDQTPSFSP